MRAEGVGGGARRGVGIVTMRMVAGRCEEQAQQEREEDPLKRRMSGENTESSNLSVKWGRKMTNMATMATCEARQWVSDSY